MPTTNQAYSFSDVLESIRLRLVDVLELDDTMVRSVASDQYKYSQEETLVAIRPLGKNPSTDAGGGRRARPERRTVRIYVSKRSSLDFVGSDSIVLNTLIDLEDLIDDSLDDWWPRDEDNTVNLTVEPLHPVDSTNGPPVRQADSDIGEVYSMLAYEVVYIRPNNTPQP